MGSAAFGLQFAATEGIKPLIYLGRAEEALDLLPQARRYVGLEAEIQSPEYLSSRDFTDYMLCLAHAGQLTQAREHVGLVMERIEERLTRRQVNTATLDSLLGTALILDDVDVAKKLADQLEEVAGRPGIARLLGQVADLSGEWDRAQEYFHKALEVSINMRDRPETALSRLDMAELLLSHYPGQRDEAMEHLGLAIAEFRDMKMQPSLDRAIALKGKAESAPIPTPALPDGLTRREAQVLGLMATGCSNSEIAKELDLSIRTVERHVTNIYSKIDARGRADAIAYALRHDINNST